MRDKDAIATLVRWAQRSESTLAGLNESERAHLLAQLIGVFEVVYGVWPDSSEPGGFAADVVKGFAKVQEMARTHVMPSTILQGAVMCKSKAELEAFRRLYGDARQTPAPAAR